MNTAEKTEDSKAKRMLLKLQQRSWEMELLFSGFAIYGLVELRSYIEYISLRSPFSTSWEDSVFEMLYSFTMDGLGPTVSLFIVLLFTHIFLRGFWVALIGLRQASGQLDPTSYQIRNFSKRGKVYGEIDFDKYTKKVENLANSTFGLAFLSFFISVAFFLFIIWLIAIPSLTMLHVFNLWKSAYGNFSVFNYYTLPICMLFLWVVFHLLAGLFTFFDFILSGRLRNIKNPFFHGLIHLSIGYIGIVTLSFLWRPFLANYWNSKLTSRFFYFFIALLLIVSFFDEANYSTSAYHPLVLSAENKYDEFEINETGIKSKNIYMSQFYFDEIEANSLYPISYIIIPSKRVRGRLFEVFIQNELYEGTLRNWPDSLQPLRSTGLTFMESDYYYNRSETEHVLKTKQTLKSSFEFGIDENTVLAKNSSVDFYTHPSINREGVLCFFPLSDSLTIGKHYFKLTFRRLDEKGKTKSVVYEIPFIYEGQ